MLDQLNNLNIETCSDAELKALVKQTLPIVSVFIKASQKLFSEDQQPNKSLCDNCDKKLTCSKPCEKLEAKLPSQYEGSRFLNNKNDELINEISDAPNTNNHKSGQLKLRAIDKVRTDEVFELYKSCSGIFSKKEWRVITLRLDEGQTFKAIGKSLGIATSTASDTFRRAKRRMGQHYSRQVFGKTTRKNTSIHVNRGCS